MKFLCLSALLMGLATPALSEEEQCSTTWKCHPTTSPPVLDANHDDWKDVDAYTTTLVNTVAQEYDAGSASYKCLYDTEYIYFALEIPGEYRFSTEDNHLCAAVATMMKIGEKASYVNMGGCPDAMGGCADGVPDTCDDYRVDIGGHWELKGTQQSTLYEMSSTVVADRQATDVEPAGNDLIANKDDEYAVSPFCRFDDDDAAAGNEWSGAWAHTNPVEGEFGMYHFEMSRTLKTPSSASDAQLTPGETIQFGVAFWDPYQIDETGWNDIGHFVTGCGTKWIDLELVVDGEPATTGSGEEATVTEGSGAEAAGAQDEGAETGTEAPSGAFLGAYISFALLATAVSGLF